MHVVVAGGAIGGTVVALLLAGAGARVTLLERVADPRNVGAGILLQPNGLAVLYGLGLREALQAIGRPGRTATISDAAGRPLLTTRMPDFGEGLDHFLALRRSRLLAVLLDAVRAHPAIETRFGAEVSDATAAGVVTYHDAATGRTDAIEADLVVGADGVHSRVRAGADFGARVARTGVQYVRGLIDGATGQWPIGEAWTGLGLFGQAPVDGGLYFFTAAGAPPLARALDAHDLAAFRAAWERAYPRSRPILGRVGAFDDLLLNEVIRVDCARFVAGRLVLLGDAAHAMAPNLGMGANSALVDAAALAAEIAKGDDPDATLARYDARRRSAVRRIQNLGDAMGRLADSGRRAPVRLLRDTALRVAGRVPGVGERGARSAQQEDPATLFRTARQWRLPAPQSERAR